MAQRFADRVEVIGVASRDQMRAMEDFVARHDMDHVRHIADVDGEVWRRFGVVGQPAWVFIDGETGERVRVMGAMSTGDLTVRLESLASG